jgi:isoquinoline 1-oxidoreductase subunit beta
MSTSRRELLKAGGAAIVLRVPILSAAAAAAEAPAPAFAPNGWVRVGRDGTVTLVVGRSEMGQGVRTSLAMILADELGAEWSAVAIEQASPGPGYEHLNTGGSGSVEDSWLPLRTAAAAAREMLVAAAATRWKAEPSACRAERGSVVHGPSGRRLSFGALARAAAALPVPKEPRRKEIGELTLVGTPVRRVDGPAIVSGRARYGLDARLPGMRYAAVARPPVAGGRAARWDADKARAVPGVRGVHEVSTGIAVVADDTWSAFSGRDALAVAWDSGPNASLTTAELWARIDRAFDGPMRRVTRAEGDVAAALAGAARRIQASYRDGFQAHASVEPQNCVASVSGGRCEIWAPTQNPQRVQKEAAKVLGFSEDRVAVHVTLIGGGFGRRLAADYATEAVEVARAAATPVQVVWSRDDDFAGDFVHPGGRADLEAGLDASGRLVAWRHRAATLHLSMFGAFDPKDIDEDSPWGGVDTPYAVPNLSVENNDVESPVRTGAWRSVFYPANVFARESFVDEVAAATGKDPVALRRELLSSGDAVAEAKPWRLERRRLERVVALAAEKAGWGAPLAGPAFAGRRAGRGIACNIYHGRTCLAHVAEVSVGAAGDVRVHRIVTAADCGVVVNPLGLAGQVESGVAWGLSAAICGEVTYERGAVAQRSYGDYAVLRYGQMPEVEVHTVPSDRPPSGFGEQPVPCVAPAVANAIFAATGRRVRRLPIRPADLS